MITAERGIATMTETARELALNFYRRAHLFHRFPYSLQARGLSIAYMVAARDIRWQLLGHRFIMDYHSVE